MENIPKNNSGGRESKFELLRIVAMVMIVGYHFFVGGKVSLKTFPLGVNLVWSYFLYSGGDVGVNLFVLISAYFLATTTHVKIEKLFQLSLKMVTYCLGLLGLFSIFTGYFPSFREILIALFPASYNVWWFASTYFIYYLCVPYFNRLSTSFSKEEYVRVILFLGGLWVVSPFILPGSNSQFSKLVWFCYLHLIGGFIYRFRKKISKYKHFCFIIILFSYFIRIIFPWLEHRNSFYTIHQAVYTFTEIYGLPTFTISVSLFIIFLEMKISENRYINRIATLTFGVYLLHEHPLVREFIWQKLFHIADFVRTPMLIPYSLFAIFTVFVTCSFIDFLMNYYFQLYNRPIQKLASWLENRFDSLVSKVESLF